MKYKKYSIKTRTDAEDIVCAALNEAGITSLEIEDGLPFSEEDLKEIFVDEVPVKDIPEGVAYVSFYLEDNVEEKKLLAAAMNALEELKGYSDIGEGGITASETEDADWIDKWKEFFRAFYIELEGGKKMGIIPSWEDDAALSDAGICIHIDPGTAFGTGAHETTRLCIRELSKYVKKGSRVLDLGTGSGILSMAAFLLGASVVRATEVDSNAVPVVKENFEKNGLAGEDFELFLGDVCTDDALRSRIGGGFDIIVANILPQVLIPLCPHLKDFAGENCIVIFSGILTEKKEGVMNALECAGFDVISAKEEKEWTALVSVCGGER
ncbi:MAG: 50S ribosomal protein L11 methyltransferase [Lachnospiraceae bacterium]|nr:50S ribosomal protein L11 methyltransferase [Lachnospiraceae bacterium]